MCIKPTITILLTTTLILVAGCIPSLYPLHSDEDVVTRHEILGRWVSQDDSQSWQFTQRDGNSYKLAFVDNKGHSGSFVTHLTEIDGQLFMDLYPIASGPDNADFHRLHWLPTYTFFRIDLSSDSLSLSFLDPNWLKKNIADYPELSWHQREEKTVLLTTETEELRGVVAKLLDSEGAFTKPYRLTRAHDDHGT